MKLFKKALSFIMCVSLVFLSMFSYTVVASTADLHYYERGVLTDGTYTAYYFIDKDNKVLYITGDGVSNAYTPDYPNADSGPFAGRTDITKIVIEEDVARVGDYVCANIKNADTLEIQSNLLSSGNSMSSKAMIGCTGLRNIQADSSLVSTNVLLEVIKGALNIASGNWLSLVKNGISVVSTGVNGDGSLDNDTVRAIVNDYIMTGEEIYLGDMDTLTQGYQQRLACPCYSNNAYHHNYTVSVYRAATCTAFGTHYHHCPTCGDAYYTDDIEPLGHSYVSTVFVEPSCTVEGIMKNYCSRCKEATYTAIQPTGHVHGTWCVSEAARVGKRGTLVMLCDECSAQMSSKTYVISSSTVYNYKTGINPELNTVNDLKNMLAEDGYIFYFTNNSTELLPTSRVGTGTLISSIRPTGGIVTEISTVILYGDLNGDGLINLSDLDTMKEYAFLDGNNFTADSDFFKAADLNGDGAVDAFDYFFCDGIISGARAFDQSVDYGY